MRRIFSQFLDNQVLQAETQQNQSQADFDEISQIDNMLADQASVFPALATFFQGVSEVAANPGSVPARQSMIGTAQALVSAQETEPRKTEQAAAVLLQVGHLERFNPAIRELGSLLTRPRFLECHRLAPFVERGTDVDVVLDLMIHDLDVILSIVPSPVAGVEAVGVPVITSSPDIANARIRFADGAIANVTASRVSLKRERKLRIFQPDTYISLDYGEKRLRICRRGAASPGGLAAIEVEERVLLGEDALAEEIRAFLDAVRTRRPPLVSGREGLRAVELADQILACVEDELRRRA